MPSTIELVDQAFLSYIDKKLNISTTTNAGWKKIPVLWVSAERAFQIKNNSYRDENGALILPLITIERSEVVKDPTKKGTAWSHIYPVNDEKGGTIEVARRIQQYVTSKFANADAKRNWGSITDPNVGPRFPKPNEKVVYQTITMPLPVYINVTYKVTLVTEYQQQMNDAIAPFLTKPGQINYFTLETEGHQFEGFMPSSFELNNNLSEMKADERRFETIIPIRILAYLMGEGANAEYPKVTIRENAVEVVIPRERVVVMDGPEEHTDPDRWFDREI